jgi:hypothetical protein
MSIQPAWAYIIGIAFGALITAISAYIIQRNKNKASAQQQTTRQKFEMEQTLGAEILKRQLDSICAFIKSEELTALLKYCQEDAFLKGLAANLDKIARMDNQLYAMAKGSQQVTDEVRTMRTMLSERLFNPVTGRIHAGIESNMTFTSRLKEKSESKRYLGNHLLDIEIVQRVLRKEESIFIESGSTLAYCMLSIIDNISRFRNAPLRVCTNNVAIYMMLLFEANFIPVLLPGKPDNPYAATFGDIDKDGKHGDGVVTFLKENKVKVLFTTASYMDVDYGPHVSSSQNHALKRILNEYASVPGISRRNICVIAAENINRAVKDSQIAKNCKLIFDPEGREDILLYSQALAQDKQAWEAHLQNPNNYIIAGSNDEVKCLGVLDDFVKQHDLQLYRFSVDTGIIYQMSSLNG